VQDVRQNATGTGVASWRPPVPAENRTMNRTAYFTLPQSAPSHLPVMVPLIFMV
jgi:hypothetical protein